MLPKLTVLIILLALLGAACSDSSTTTTTTVVDSTTTTTSDPSASIVFGSGSVPDTMPGAFPIPERAVIGTTLIDRERGRTEMIIRVSAEIEALTAFFTSNLPSRGFTIDSSAAGANGWNVGFSAAEGAGTIEISIVGQGVSQAVVTFNDG